MKTLKRMQLVNWHYFAFETLNFSDINFLTGKNASGKTTLIDALQLVILGDTTGHFFNKSATDKSSRNLKGYLRCEIGDKEDGTSIYLRNGRFSSYIALEFVDDETNEDFEFLKEYIKDVPFEHLTPVTFSIPVISVTTVFGTIFIPLSIALNISI